jgi:general secretion pathway protein A
MYNRSFGVRKNPFNMTPDPAFLYLTAQHREALVGLSYAILQRKGFVVLTGEAGTGKTTLLARVLQFIPGSQVQSSVILNPTLTPAEFLELALLDFGVTHVPASKAQRLWLLRNLLLKAREQGRISALIIDEAHKLSREVLEEIRLLGNFEESDEKFLQIVLIGQNELDEILNREDLRQLKQRIAVRLSIGPLASPEVGLYIRHRWLRAGGDNPPFSTEAVSFIAHASQGIPRLINGLCDNALTLAFGEGSSAVEARHVQASAVDLHISPPPPLHLPVEPPSFLTSLTSEPVSVPATPSYNGADSKSSLWTRWKGRVRLTPEHETGEL